MKRSGFSFRLLLFLCDKLNYSEKLKIIPTSEIQNVYKCKKSLNSIFSTKEDGWKRAG